MIWYIGKWISVFNNGSKLRFGRYPSGCGGRWGWHFATLFELGTGRFLFLIFFLSLLSRGGGLGSCGGARAAAFWKGRC